jgi:hypothetical protein
MPLIFTRLNVEATNRSHLEKLFTNPGFSVLKEVVAARAAKRVSEYANTVVFETDNAKASAENNLVEAKRLQITLDVLREIEGAPSEWYTGSIILTP